MDGDGGRGGATAGGGAAGRYQLLVSELATSEDQLGPTVRAVYESEEGNPAAFLSTLEAYTRRMDADIEKICSKHYQGFIDSVDELLKVQGHATDLKDLVADINEDLIESGKGVMQTARELVELRQIQRNIIIGIESLSACLPVLRLYAKANAQLAARRYYPALKTLKELERVHLPAVSRFTFAKKMRQRVPMLRKKIQKAAFSEMQDFLASIRDRSAEIGEAAIMQTLQSLDLSEKKDLGEASLLQSMGSRHVPPSGATKLTADGGSEDLCASDQADFSPIYRCLHIYEVLGVRGECETYYKEERKKQAELVLQPARSMASAKAFRNYFFQVSGFFLVEDTVLTTTKSLLTRQWVDELWDTALNKIIKVIHAQLAVCTTDATIYEVKTMIVLFIQTLQGYGYNVARLYETLLQVRDRYTTVLMQQCAGTFKRLFRNDNCAPLEVADEDEYREVIQHFPYDDRVLVEAPFPKSFPFSAVVPKVYQEVKGFIDMNVKFAEDLDLSHTEVDEIIRKSTNQLLSKTLSGAMSSLMREGSPNLQQLTQMSINTTHLEASAQHLERYISSLTHSLADDVHVTRLHGSSAFKDARTAAEEQIFLVLQSQIDQFLELAEYDWAPAAEHSDSSEYIFDMLAYLTTRFASLTTMPVEVARMAYFSTCKYICRSLTDMITDPAIKRINANGIKNFALDVETCEQYAQNCPLVEEGDQLFQGVFSSLRELVDLFVKWDWPSYLDPSERQGRYRHLSTRVALAVLEKYDDSEKRGMFSMRSTEEKRQRAEIASYLKALRGQVIEGGSSVTSDIFPSSPRRG